MAILFKIKKFFTLGHQRSIQAKKNIISSFLIKGLSIVISLVFVPLTISYINPTQYGIWLTLSSIIAWFSFFDIGFGNGLRNKYAEAKATGNILIAKKYISTTYVILTLLFSIVWFCFIIVNFFVDWSKVLNAPNNMEAELSVLAIIVFSFFCIQIVLKTINVILIADQKPAKASFFDMIGQLFALIIIFILTKTTDGSLIYLGLTFGFVPILVLLISSFIFFNTVYKDLKPSFKFVEFSIGKDILKLGIKFFIIQIAFIVIYQTSNIIIAQVASPDDVTIYNIAFKYFGIATMVFSIIMTPFWSAFTNAFTIKDYDWMKLTYNKLAKISIVIILSVILLFGLSSYAYKLWIGDVVEVRYTVSLMVAFFVMLNIWNSLHSILLNGMGKIKLQLFLSIIGMVLNIPLAIYFGNKFGIEGVVVAGVLLSIISAIIAPLQLKLILNKKAIGIWNA